MQKNLLKCWEYFNCIKKACPAYQSSDPRCWLQCETHCHEEIQGTWLEKMEACLKCEVFAKNFREEDLITTLTLIKNQFEDYKAKVLGKTKQLEEAQRRLTELLTALEEARSGLEKNVEERTRELRQAQAQLVQTAKMATVGQFSAGLAHEINNPLAGILNCVRMLLADPGIKGQQRGYLELTLKGLFRIENTIKQILSFSGQPRFNPDLLNFNQLIEETLQFVKYRMSEKKIRLEQRLDEKIDFVSGDHHLLQQTFINIINNAVDALPEEGGKLTITTSHQSKEIEINFVDNGQGIKKEYLDRVFDPFFTTKETGKGVGLGLYLSYNFIQQHHGSISIHSEEGKFTAVTIKLPIVGVNNGV